MRAESIERDAQRQLRGFLFRRAVLQAKGLGLPG